MKKGFAILSVSLFFLTGNMYAQPKPGRNFREISNTMKQYFDSVGKTGNDYKQFKRWEWYYSTRLGEGNKLVNNTSMNRQAYENMNSSRLLNPGEQQINSGGWTSLGPTSVTSDDKGIGRVNRISFHPSNANIMYAATATGGLWITTDNGANWFSYTEGIPNMCLSGVEVHPTNPNIIYILTGDGDATFGGAWAQFRYTKYSTGVLKSYDGGFTWSQTALNWLETDAIVAYKLIMHPTNPEILLVATSEGLWRTTNGGNTWTSQNTDIWFWDIEFHPTNPSIIYAGGNNSFESRIYTSTDAGASFTETADFPFSGSSALNNRIAIAVTPASANNVYVLTGPATASGAFRGFYRSTDAGATFALRADAPNILGRSATGNDAEDQARYDLCLAISPTNANVLTTGGIRIWTSSNAGTSFTYQDNYVNSTSYYHDDIHDLRYHPLRNNELYMCADGGIYKSTDNGDNWSYLHNNMQVTQYYRISINPLNGAGNENIIIGGTQDNGTNKRGSGGGSGFSRISGGDGMDCYIDPDGINSYVVSVQDGKFYYSLNAGATFELVCDPDILAAALGVSVEEEWVTPVAEITGNVTQFVIGYSPVIMVTRLGTNIYSFTNLGWSGHSFVKTARGNSNRIYAGDNNYGGNNHNLVKTTTNSGSGWSTVLNETNHNGIPVTDLAFNPDNGNEIWLTFGGYSATKKVWYSGDGGANWTNVTGTLPNVPINCIVYDDNNGNPDDALYIGTDIGVFYRDNNLGDWVPFSNGLPVVEVTDLEIHEAAGLLRCGTYGRGMWQTSLYSNCSSNITLNTGNIEYYKPYYFQASNSINSQAWHFGTGANVFYKAGVEINLTPGFQSSGNIFKASIGPCGGGVPGLLINKDSAEVKAGDQNQK